MSKTLTYDTSKLRGKILALVYMLNRPLSTDDLCSLTGGSYSGVRQVLLFLKKSRILQSFHGDYGINYYFFPSTTNVWVDHDITEKDVMR